MVALRKEKDPPATSEVGGAGIADSAYKLRLAVKSRIFVEENDGAALIFWHCCIQKTPAGFSLCGLCTVEGNQETRG